MLRAAEVVRISSGPDSPLPHPVPFNLYDPFGLSSKKSDEAKARGLKIEVNNGR